LSEEPPLTDATADLNTVAWGDPDAQNAALLVHGLTGRADAFRPLVERLESEGLTGWWFLAVDLRGRGGTGPVDGTAGIPVHAADLLALLDREGLDGVAYVGHSLGAMIGVYLAAHHPDRISKLALVDGGADVTEEIDGLLIPVHERLKRTYPSREAYIELVKSLPVFENRWDDNLEHYFAGDVRPENGEWRHHADLATVGDDREKMRGFPLSELWPSVRCPTLVLLSTVGLAGPEEGFILPPQEARRMRETIPDCELVEVEDTNHYDILYSAPKATVEAVRGLLVRA
jgi:pimeloyl-ACP methyl ester carboxylesterase